MSTSTREIAEELFCRTTSGAPPEQIAELFDEDIDWHIAGDLDGVPWIGRKVGRAGVAEFWKQIRNLIQSERFEVHGIVVQDDRAVVFGELGSRVKGTGNLIETEFAFDLTIRGDKIVRCRMFEDSYAVSRAANP